MIKRIKVKNQIEDLDEVNLCDANLAKEEGPNGEKVEANPYFTLMYVEDNVKYIDSGDNSFNPSKAYFIKEGSSRVKEAKPIDLGLYEYNGLTIVPTKDKVFKEREYYLDEEGNTVATPAKCRLKEKDPSSRSYPKYTLNYKPDSATPQKQLASFSGYDSWETAKALYEACANNVQEINSIYNADGMDAVKDYVKNNFKELSTNYKEKTLLKQQRIGAENSLNLTRNKRSMIYNSANYKAEIEKQILEQTGKTMEDYIKSVNANRISRDDINKFNDIGGRRIKYYRGHYIVSTPKVDGIYIIRKDNGAFRYEVQFNTLEDALNGIVVLNTVAANLASNIKGKSFEEAEQLYENASNELTERLIPTTNDSCKYCTYKVKDNKKIITGYYNNYFDALFADEDNKLVKKVEGVYYNEANGKYLAIPQAVYNSEEVSEEKSKKLIRLGEFNTELEAIKAVQVLARLNYDIQAFFESKFYLNHLDECQEARDYYFEENKGTKEDEVGFEKTDEGYKVWVVNPHSGEKIYLNEVFEEKSQAQALVKQAENSPEKPYDFLYNYTRRKENLAMETEEELDEFQVKGIHQNALTHEDVVRLIEKTNVDELSEYDIAHLLTGEFGARAGTTYIFRNVLEYLKNRYNLSDKDIDYNVALVFQNKLVNKFVNSLFDDIKNESIVATSSRDLYNVQNYLERIILDETGISARKFITPRGLKRFAEELVDILKEMDK